MNIHIIYIRNSHQTNKPNRPKKEDLLLPTNIIKVSKNNAFTKKKERTNGQSKEKNRENYQSTNQSSTPNVWCKILFFVSFVKKQSHFKEKENSLNFPKTLLLIGQNYIYMFKFYLWPIFWLYYRVRFIKKIIILQYKFLYLKLHKYLISRTIRLNTLVYLTI